MSNTVEPNKEVTGEVPASPEPELSEDVAADKRKASAALSLKVVVALLLLVSGFVALLFPLATGWAFGYGFVTTFGGEVLSRTNGLDPGVFEVGYWFSLWFNLAVVGWSVVRAFKRREHPWRPLFWATLVQAMVFGVFATLDAQGHVDAPDGLTTTATLGLAWLWTYVLPVVALAFVIRLGVEFWRLGAKSNASARRVIAGSTLVVLLPAYLVGMPGMPGVHLTIDEDARLDIWRGPPGDSAGERQTYLAASTKVTSWEEREREARTHDEGAFTRCMNELAVSKKESEQTEVDRVVDRLLRSVQRADAEDLAIASLIKVCRRHAREAIRDLGQYFRRAVKNAMKTLCVRAAREELLPADELPEYQACTRFAQSEDARTFREAMSRLSAEDQLVLVLHYGEGRPYAEVAHRLGTTEVSARQRGNRAVKRIKNLLAEVAD